MVQCVFYFRLKDATVRALENVETASEALKLWVAYCKHLGVDDEYHGRFKVRQPHNLIRPLYVTLSCRTSLMSPLCSIQVVSEVDVTVWFQ